jgi:uncharacterized cupin superfamily protein
MPKIDIAAVPELKRCGYPSPYDQPCRGRSRKRLGDAGGLSQFGVNLLTLEPGAWSAQRHWHDGEDEFVYMVSGELVLIADEGEQILRPGDCAAFPKNDGNGHHLVNRSNASAVCLEVGTRTQGDGDMCYYPDADLVWNGPKGAYTKRDGTPYPTKPD